VDNEPNNRDDGGSGGMGKCTPDTSGYKRTYPKKTKARKRQRTICAIGCGDRRRTVDARGSCREEEAVS
jgi:hypothetical protein